MSRTRLLVNSKLPAPIKAIFLDIVGDPPLNLMLKLYFNYKELYRVFLYGSVIFKPKFLRYCDFMGMADCQ